MKKTNVKTILSNSKNAQVLLRDTGKALRVKTGLKGGHIKDDIQAKLKASPILF